MKTIYFWMALVVNLCTGISASYSQIINIEDKRASFSDSTAIYEKIDLGINVIKNQDKIFALQGSAQFEFQLKKRVFLSLTKVKLFKAGGQEFVNEGFQHLRYNSILTESITYELFGQAQYNEKTAIKIRLLGGTGLKFKIMERKNKRINYGLSIMYEYEQELESDAVHRDARFSTYLSGKITFSPQAILSSTTYYQPLVKNFSDYRISSQTTFQFKIGKHWSFTTDFNLVYDSNLPSNIPDLVYDWSNGIRYEF